MQTHLFCDMVCAVPNLLVQTGEGEREVERAGEAFDRIRP